MDRFFAFKCTQSNLAKMRAELASSQALRERNAWQRELAAERGRADKYGAALERATEQIEALEVRNPVLFSRPPC